MKKDLEKKVRNATKWSFLTQIFSKLITPLTSIILARLLTPEVFGIIATLTILVSFTEMLADAGFQRYIVQNDFLDKKSLTSSLNVAFTTNLILSFIFLGIIVIFNHDISIFLGNSEIGFAIIIASLQLPLNGVSSIQIGRLRRNFEFKVLFFLGILSSMIPFLVTIPLALFGFGYWSIILANLLTSIINNIFLYIKSSWKPRFQFNFKVLSTMLAFSIWSLIESISIWMTTWIDMFIIANRLNDYYLGLYRNSITIVNSIMALFTASIIPVLFSALSRLQSDEEKFHETFMKFQKNSALFIFPIGIGSFVFRDFLTMVLLGEQWQEASIVVGLWALSSSFMIIFSAFFSEVYRAKGLPKLSFLAQVSHLIFLIPTILISSQEGFLSLVYWRTFVRLQFIIIHFVFIRVIFKFSIYKIIFNLKNILFNATLMGIVGFLLAMLNSELVPQFIFILLCTILYFILSLLFKDTRQILYPYLQIIKKYNSKRN